MKCHGLVLVLMLSLSGCSAEEERLKTEFLNNTCIKPLIDYHYLTCKRIDFTINGEAFYIPENFETDLASIPKIAWPIMAPAHSSLIRPAIVHDWFYRKTCDFTRFQTDLIFYHMLKNDGVSTIRASMMYYAVRWFGWNYYNEDYCDEQFKGLDKEVRGVQIASLFGHRRENNHRMGAQH
jgi:hypothetical protein